MINLDKYLLKVDNPAQYLGNEMYSVHKKEHDVHMAIIYPDLYEVGMSSLAIRILYSNSCFTNYSQKLICSN